MPENLAKLDRIEKFYRNEVTDTPQIVFQVLDLQRERLLAAQARFGDVISPYQF